ncbi:hypothetical protein [Roseovarius salinarum]|uniref:hypothetical protein n=1 Tax=Roseovarius salinarum TaxID=1981892 RepID=UPI000C323DF3|nr:hypothetical protein [Roseovarius salinarum]
MGITEDLADKLAIDTLKAVDATGDEDLIKEVSETLGATSQTAQEAFLTSVRVRRADNRARAYLLERVKAFKTSREGGGPSS